MKAQILLIFAALCVASTMGYTYSYPYRNMTCNITHARNIGSYHIHLLYWNYSAKSRNDSYIVRSMAVQEFDDILTGDCTDDYSSTENCMSNLTDAIQGPFSVSQWFINVLPSSLQRVQEWFIQNRGEFSILIHPNTGCVVSDLTQWALWGGASYPLNQRWLRQYTQVMEEGLDAKNSTYADDDMTYDLDDVDIDYSDVISDYYLGSVNITLG